MMSGPLFTVFTPTFNRAATLPRVYASLKEQTFRDFEWLIVDDGSTDETSNLAAEWMNERAFNIRYVGQEHAGKHVCTNVALQMARGRYFATLDSDDWYVPTALETFAQIWASIPPKEYNEFSGVVGLCAAPSGALIGTSFPQDVLDTTYLEASSVSGDKAGCGRVEVNRAFPFPVLEGESLVIEGIVYRRMSRHFRLRCVNKILKIKDYQPDGLSANMRELLISNPLTTRLYYVESLQDCNLRRPFSLVRCSGNLVRYSLHAHLGLRDAWKNVSKPYYALGVPLGLGLYLRDRLRRGLRAVTPWQKRPST
jgi:glycosyltransferase involved in cell wall biosynthesis